MDKAEVLRIAKVPTRHRLDSLGGDMFNWLKKLQLWDIEPDKTVVVYKVIEIRAPRTAQKWSKETKETVSTLASHPGFVALMDRVALHRQMLEHKCSHEFHKDLRESDYLQAGVFWLGYLDRLIAESTKTPRSVAVDAYDEELEAFKELDARIERIGMEPPQEV